jgi:translation initiation factor 2 beta subunit (eIF-2beta)/eIF-5
MHVLTIDHAVPLAPSSRPQCRRCGVHDLDRSTARTPAGRVVRLRCRACGLERTIERHKVEITA